MASSLDSRLAPDLRVGIALTIDRQDLVNQQASWALPGLAVAQNHLIVQGQPAFKPPRDVGDDDHPCPPTSIDLDHRRSAPAGA